MQNYITIAYSLQPLLVFTVASFCAPPVPIDDLTGTEKEETLYENNNSVRKQHHATIMDVATGEDISLNGSPGLMTLDSSVSVVADRFLVWQNILAAQQRAKFQFVDLDKDAPELVSAGIDDCVKASRDTVERASVCAVGPAGRFFVVSAVMQSGTSEVWVMGKDREFRCRLKFKADQRLEVFGQCASSGSPIKPFGRWGLVALTRSRETDTRTVNVITALPKRLN